MILDWLIIFTLAIGTSVTIDSFGTSNIIDGVGISFAIVAEIDVS